MKAFGGRLFRPDVAPADVVEAAEPPPAGGNGQPVAGPITLNNPLFETSPQRKA
jgi:hypothetical protein